MNGWIYVLQLTPSDRVKVGQTVSLTKRLNQHLAAAGFNGGSIDRIGAFAVADNVGEVERQILDKLSRTTGATVVHGKETFGGLTFDQVSEIINAIIQKHAAPREIVAVDGLAEAAVGVMDRLNVTRLSLDALREELDNPAILTNADLGRELRRAGIYPEAIHCPVRAATARGVKREKVFLAPAA